MSLSIPANQYPAIRIAAAMAHKVTKKILLCPAGGIGDMVCAEPVMRYCMEKFTDCTFSLYAKSPELYRHLKFEKIYVDEPPPENMYLPIYFYQNGLANQFMNANLMHGVDFASVSALRGQLPLRSKIPELWPHSNFPPGSINVIRGPKVAALHLGKTWASRTLPTQWWDEVIAAGLKAGWTLILVGNKCVDIGMYALAHASVLDWREQLSLDNFIWLLQHVEAIVTNDSSPIHIGATGDAKIAFVPTIRPPWHLMHYRRGGLGWRMKAFYDAKMWEYFDSAYLPNTLGDLDMTQPPIAIARCLPADPSEVFKWFRSCP